MVWLVVVMLVWCGKLWCGWLWCGKLWCGWCGSLGVAGNVKRLVKN